MALVEKIELDLDDFKIQIRYETKAPLILHFDKPARRFYFSLIALVVTEMKRLGKPEFIYIRQYEKVLKQLDNSLSGQHASNTIDNMLDKIRKSWRYILPDLETGAHFKILGRNRISPYEKGGRYKYECSEDECDIWSNLFQYDENNIWRFKFAIDSASLSLEDILLKFKDLRDDVAWQAFLNHMGKAPSKNLSTAISESEKSTDTIPISENKAILGRLRPKNLLLLAAGAMAIVIISVGTFTILNRKLSPTLTPDEEIPDVRPSIAVLPFVNVSDDPDKEYICDGITEELINTLARVKGLRVISRTSAFYFKDKAFELRTIGEKLNVENILEGSVRVSGDNLRISVQLVNVADDSHLWSEAYNRELKDIFTLQDDLTMKIISKLSAELMVPDMKLLLGKGTTNLDAYLNYLYALYHRFKATPKDNFIQRQYLLKAIKLDPGFSSAYALLAHTHLLDMRFKATESPEVSLNSAYELALKAIALDDRNADAYLTLGWVHRHWRNYDKAVESAKMAVQLAPNYAFALTLLGIELMFADRLTEAIPEFEKAISLDPKSIGSYWNIGETYRNLGRYDKALEYLVSAEKQQPQNFIIYLNQAACYSEMGQSDKAHSAALKILKLQPDFSCKAWAEFLPYKNHARVDKWLESLRKAGLPD